MNATRDRLLVVDDDLVQRVLIGKIGAKLGYDTVVASSYEAATELLTRDTFEVMALDLSLGERDGVELLRFVAERDLREMSIVIISGCDDGSARSLRVVSSERTKLELSEAYRAYAAIHQEGRKYLQSRRAEP